MKTVPCSEHSRSTQVKQHRHHLRNNKNLRAAAATWQSESCFSGLTGSVSVRSHPCRQGDFHSHNDFNQTISKI